MGSGKVFGSHFFTGLAARLVLPCVMAGVLVSGCRAQNPPASVDAKTDRKIEVLVRSQLGVPGDWNVQVGPRAPSAMAGFDTVTLSFSPSSAPSRVEKLDFLLSKDDATLIRLSKWDLNKLPSEQIDLDGRPVRGAAGAKVEIVNFDDLECPYCARMHAQLFPETLDHYKGLVKIVYKDDPLVEIHPWALRAAVDASCLAAENGDAYWRYVDYLHAHGDDVTGPDHDVKKADATLDKLAREEGTKLDKTRQAAVESCVAKQDEAPVRASMKEAAGLNIDGTPTLFVDGERIAGAQPIDVLWAAIDRALRAQGVTPPPPPHPAPAAEKPSGGAE